MVVTPEPRARQALQRHVLQDDSRSLHHGDESGWLAQVAGLAAGMVMDRDMVVSALSESPPWRTYDIGDVRLIEVDNDNAVLVYTGTAYREADAPAFVGAMSSAYHRTDGGWKLALYQQTQILD